MSQYRLYRLDGAGKIKGISVVASAADDVEALSEARKLRHLHEVEV